MCIRDRAYTNHREKRWLPFGWVQKTWVAPWTSRFGKRPHKYHVLSIHDSYHAGTTFKPPNLNSVINSFPAAMTALLSSVVSPYSKQQRGKNVHYYFLDYYKIFRSMRRREVLRLLLGDQISRYCRTERNKKSSAFYRIPNACRYPHVFSSSLKS